MATPPRNLLKAGLLESRWLEISTHLFFFFFSFQIIKEVPPPPAEESEVSDQMGWVVGWDRELTGLAPGSGPHRAEVHQAQTPTAYKAAKREVFGSFLTKDKQELISDSRRHNGFWKVFSLQEKIEMRT